MSETHILTRLLLIYFPRISEFGPASEFRGGTPPPPQTPLGTPLRCGLELRTNFFPFKKAPKTECGLDSRKYGSFEYYYGAEFLFINMYTILFYFMTDNSVSV
jgi:hypothetical protein